MKLILPHRTSSHQQVLDNVQSSQSTETQTTSSIVQSNKCNSVTTTTPIPDIMPMIVFDEDKNKPLQENKPHLQLQQLNSSPAYTLSTSSFAFEDTGNNKQRRYSHLVPIINYPQPNTPVDQNVNVNNQYYESRPFLLVEDGNDNEDDDDDYFDQDEDDGSPSNEDTQLNKTQNQPRRRSTFLKISDAIGRRLSQTRLSFSSVGAFSHQSKEEENSQMRQKKTSPQPRTSLCFLPVARTVSDPSCGMMQVVIPPTSPILLDQPSLNNNIPTNFFGQNDQNRDYEQQLLMFQQKLGNIPSVVVTGASEGSLNENSFGCTPFESSKSNDSTTTTSTNSSDTIVSTIPNTSSTTITTTTKTKNTKETENIPTTNSSIPTFKDPNTAVDAQI